MLNVLCWPDRLHIFPPCYHPATRRPGTSRLTPLWPVESYGLFQFSTANVFKCSQFKICEDSLSWCLLFSTVPWPLVVRQSFQRITASLTPLWDFRQYCGFQNGKYLMSILCLSLCDLCTCCGHDLWVWPLTSDLASWQMLWFISQFSHYLTKVVWNAFVIWHLKPILLAYKRINKRIKTFKKNEQRKKGIKQKILTNHGVRMPWNLFW